MSVEVTVNHATEAYSSLYLSNAKYNIKSLSIDEKEKSYSTTNTQKIESLGKYMVHVVVKITFSITNNSQIFNSIRTIYTRSTKLTLKKLDVTFFNK
jgi:hypothetical protein